MYQRINHLASDRNRPHSVETGCGHPPLKSHISNPLASPKKGGKADDQLGVGSFPVLVGNTSTGNGLGGKADVGS